MRYFLRRIIVAPKVHGKIANLRLNKSFLARCRLVSPFSMLLHFLYRSCLELQSAFLSFSSRFYALYISGVFGVGAKLNYSWCHDRI